MSTTPGSSHGRTMALLALGVLAVVAGAAVYLFLAQGFSPATEGDGPDPSGQTAAPPAPGPRKAATILVVASISALLILLFVLGAYLVIRIGHYLAQQRVGGKPTEYVDAWGSYRLTDEQIAAATTEGKPDGDNDSDDAAPPPRPDEPPKGR